MSFLNRHLYVRTLAQTKDIIDIQLPLGYQLRHARYMPCVDLSRQKRDYIALLLLTTYPRRIFLFRQRREPNNHLQLRAAEQHFLNHIAALRWVIHANENTQIQLMMQVRLTDILYEGSVATQHFRHGRCHTRLVKSDDVY